MKKLLSFLALLFLAVICSACVNIFAVQELNQMAAKYIEKGDYKNAISRLESSVDLDANVYNTRYNLAISYLKIDECSKAMENIKEAIKLAKNDDDLANSYYTKAVINECFIDKIENKDNNENYFNYLKDANDCYNQYINLVKEAPDIEEVKMQIESNNEKIQQLSINGIQ